MTKSKRLMELMIAVNKRRKFTVRELAEEFGVSTRTIMRDLQVLDELGLPLYAEYGPHGGYRVLNERMLPPIMFSEQEALAMFFAYQSLQHYGALPFSEESVTALNKFYYYLPEDTKQKIDRLKERVVFWTPKRTAAVPHLRLLLDASLRQRPLRILYDSREGAGERSIQPIGVYSSNGHWYCPAFCFSKQRYLLFRADRVLQAESTEEDHPAVDLSGFTIADWFVPPSEQTDGPGGADRGWLELEVRLTKDGVRRCRREAWFQEELVVGADGEGVIRLRIRPDETDYFAGFFLSLGADAVVVQPPEMVSRLRDAVRKLSAAYAAGGDGEGDQCGPVTGT
ncbi:MULTISPECIES: helix-turn-helix transcriptional regulator [Paenibacillus]|uniref:helix-turn-helix transcriptional regulator n=1 Tax=Paenibacillus TaxID=44249 RepID=UPI0022B8A495|nr:YafY family protein [Paenibacillus caseinilyticus]MCZ8521553.1 YafY family protein [Paenibacillus caseinilyticus]